MANIIERYNLRATDITDTSLHLAWLDGGIQAPTVDRAYVIYENNVKKYSQKTSANFREITGLIPDTAYTYVVKTVNTSTGDVLSQSTPLVVTTNTDRYNLRATDITETSLHLAWLDGGVQAPTVDRAYVINENNVNKYSQKTSTNFREITGLIPGTAYTYVVKTINTSTGDVLSQSTPLVVTTDTATDRYNLRATDITDTSLHLAWLDGGIQAPTVDRAYVIYENNVKKYSQKTSANFREITGLIPDTAYTYVIKTVNTITGDVLSQSTPLVVTTDTDRYNLRATYITGTSLRLVWLDGGIQAPTVDRAYVIYENNVNKYSQNTSANFRDITGLILDTTYTYVVKTVNTSTGDVLSQSSPLVIMI